MRYFKGLQFADKALAIATPLLGGALFAGISIAVDLAGEAKTDFLDPAYILETAIISAAGALLSAALFASRYVISAAKYAESNYLSIPWDSQSGNNQVQVAKLDATQAVIDLFNLVENKLSYTSAQEVAVRAVHLILEEQKQNLNQHGRLTFTSPKPQYLESLKHDSVAATSFGSDGYGLVFGLAERGDVIYATDFQNSAYWWLDPKVAFSFFELNLGAINRGARIVRIFGRNHDHWDEDESGAKQELIELQAKVKGIEVYTIEYADFNHKLGFDIQEIDHLILTKQGKPYPGIEWNIDLKGDTQDVYYVLSESRLDEIVTNFNKLLSSSERGSSLRRIQASESLDPAKPEEFKKIKTEFGRIASSLIRKSP